MSVEERTLEEFGKACIRQSRKGIKKYGHEIELDSGYDWYAMFIEEVVDATRYATALQIELEAAQMELASCKEKIARLEAVHDDIGAGT
jgi:hypothetical protein